MLLLPPVTRLPELELLRGLELLQDRSVGSRGGEGEDVDMGRGEGSRNLGCRCCWYWC